MLRRNHRFFQSIQVLRDVILVGVSFYLAFNIRFSFPVHFPYESISDPKETAAIFIMLIAVWPAMGWANGLYISRRSQSIASELFDVVRVTALAFLVLVTITYFVRDVRYSRATLILWAIFSVCFVSTARMGFRWLLQKLRSRGYNLRHVVIVGGGALAQRVLETIREHDTLGLRVIGIAVSNNEENLVGKLIFGTKVIGTIDTISSLLEQHNIDQVIVALPVDKLGALKGIMAVLSQETVDVRLVPDFYQYMTLCGSIEELNGMPIINLQSTPLAGWNLLTKRGFDIFTSSVALLFSLPAIAISAALIKFTSHGPVFFKQLRVGMDGRIFTMFKLRTMSLDAENNGARMTEPGDPRCTTLGAFLRRFSIDELPQLFNVLRGDMSLVGPRPEQPAFIDEFKRQVPRYALRHKIKAGMTGWAQINGMRGQTCMKKRIELDLYYIENWSILLDLKILLRTIFGGFLSPNAY
ncbi:MAG: undecaprenyl-phosphate glucose phosphotransferase [Deltaproteobacteria bacterium]|nr:undecaprenyl-phosphate glucose phosphotransferase [Deltaproteobacteria bacterium]